MKKFPIQENLTTASVNLESLVSFLRDLGFIGSLHIELSAYDADITFTHPKLVVAREHDRISGKIAYGVDALERILIRADEQCGRIHVYQTEEVADEDADETFVSESIAAGAVHSLLGRGDRPANSAKVSSTNFQPSMPVVINGMVFGDVKPKLEMPAMPGKIARDWNELLDLAAELLRTIDKSFEKSNIHFPTALENACAIISNDHPFIDPERGFAYKNGLISLREQVAPEVFAQAITEALKRIFERLREKSRFRRVYHSTVVRVRLLVLRRQEQFDKFVITPRLEEILVD